MTEIARVPAGVATGGQFATTARAEADVALTRATRIYDPANVDGRRLAAGRILIVETAKVGGEKVAETTVELVSFKKGD